MLLLQSGTARLLHQDGDRVLLQDDITTRWQPRVVVQTSTWSPSRAVGAFAGAVYGQHVEPPPPPRWQSRSTVIPARRWLAQPSSLALAWPKEPAPTGQLRRPPAATVLANHPAPVRARSFAAALPVQLRQAAPPPPAGPDTLIGLVGVVALRPRAQRATVQIRALPVQLRQAPSARAIGRAFVVPVHARAIVATSQARGFAPQLRPELRPTLRRPATAGSHALPVARSVQVRGLAPQLRGAPVVVERAGQRVRVDRQSAPAASARSRVSGLPPQLRTAPLVERAAQRRSVTAARTTQARPRSTVVIGAPQLRPELRPTLRRPAVHRTAGVGPASSIAITHRQTRSTEIRWRPRVDVGRRAGIAHLRAGRSQHRHVLPQLRPLPPIGTLQINNGPLRGRYASTCGVCKRWGHRHLEGRTEASPLQGTHR